MALLSYMPTAGCEHLDKETVEKIRRFRKSPRNGIDRDFAQYVCLQCSMPGSFPSLDKHFSESKHKFAVSEKSVYCGGCKDLVYDPALLSNGKKRKLAESNEEDDSYLTANTSQRPCGRSGVRGLFNLGETCYMNAVLQMMVHNPLLASYFLGMGHPIHTCPISKEPEKKANESSDSEDEGAEQEKREMQVCVACGMTELFSDVTMVDQPLPAHAVNLLFASWKNIPQMSGKGQQDAQEWFMYIIDRLHEAVAQYTTPHKTNSINAANGINTFNRQCVCFFHKVFYGRYNSQITCDKCHTVSSREDEFSSISLDFKRQVKRKRKAAKEAAAAKAVTDGNAATTTTTTNAAGGDNKTKANNNAANKEPLRITVPTLHECLRAYTAPEPLSPDQYTCTKCDSRQPATKQTRLRKLPAILCVHVKRFGMRQLGPGNYVPEKYEGKLDFPLHLDMGPYTTKPPQWNDYGDGYYDVDDNVEADVKKSQANGATKNENSKANVNEKATTNGDHKSNTNKADEDAKNHHRRRGRDAYMYDLDCVVVHQGDNAHNGHYFAFCRQDNKWFRFDDEIVSATTTEDVLRQEAYLLFYSLRSLESV
ncbi:hypothetical protein HRR83_007382 [Exophiala dermatitidis]|uniref:ubiquitinyl hydrolase 1 n=2 Tax=Exophiala dermatitidis TaxID=5970 RepID=H6C1X2_EXODN|nr:ubiquitin carboxyl-terminal hydrolase 8 [Exophiala dermatitidis NIH/UT8656]KAJ4508445.1 hypothetical protein HRR75_006266 [Exophiala dermatitidis]EHY58659.1 ubiquitin carboxyl-terminal hydrolase 8 [Exophiala dermatitidis NIH/UT8656]KAJ4510356.1 hypothetical protein HRR74_006828 [Exophiala dermatitidis]KAJ4510709.1 hypothetical protein HRR73_006781 [Exophiala dermatitidis]KAJ4534964.1 hypothetical protein HRR76_006866 [Exophiala dermatitidis]